MFIIPFLICLSLLNCNCRINCVNLYLRFRHTIVDVKRPLSAITFFYGQSRHNTQCGLYYCDITPNAYKCMCQCTNSYIIGNKNPSMIFKFTKILKYNLACLHQWLYNKLCGFQYLQFLESTIR